MRGLLSCRVLKGRFGAERLSKSIFRHSQLRKRSKKLPLRRPKSFSQSRFSGTTAKERKEREENASQYAERAVTGIAENHDYSQCNSSNYATHGTSDAGDHVTALDNIDNALKEKDGLLATKIQEPHSVELNVGVIDAYVNETKTRGSAEELLLASEEEVEGREDALHATPCAVGNGFEHSNEANVTLEWHENNNDLQGEDVTAYATDGLKGPLILPDWEAVMSIITQAPAAISLICGGKNTGKSTFARYLINSLLDRYGRVGFLDTDVGQPEFTPSGCLSLHVLDKPIIGLPAMEMKDPERLLDLKLLGLCFWASLCKPLNTWTRLHNSEHLDVESEYLECPSLLHADMAGDMDTRKSTSGYVFAIAGGAVSCCSRLQKIVALSTTEAKYISATEASKEAIWLGRLGKELGMPVSTPVLGCDSQSAVYLGKNAMFHARTKHIDVRYHLIRQVLEDGLVTLTKINTQDNLADVLTKSLAKAQHEHCIQMVGVG
ncbi:hypothetical protein L7F22_027614 [Adiantum nelumboides]|nr:hypothetical protein [Adiantum nelumboides]